MDQSINHLEAARARRPDARGRNLGVRIEVLELAAADRSVLVK